MMEFEPTNPVNIYCRLQLINPHCKVFLEMLHSQLAKKITAFYRTPSVITVFVEAHHLSLTSAR